MNNFKFSGYYSGILRLCIKSYMVRSCCNFINWCKCKLKQLSTYLFYYLPNHKLVVTNEARKYVDSKYLLLMNQQWTNTNEILLKDGMVILNSECKSRSTYVKISFKILKIYT